ncbi:MAG: tetratricopeptide repeat protein, partial [Deltaproteobacteria bacterium]|nr:tetratricopeptide repeat protein [Deltaproteobacteria bacterium]
DSAAADSAAADSAAADSAAEVTAPSTLSGDLPAAPTPAPQPLPPELASEAASAFDDDPISADRLLRTGHAGTPTPDHLPQRPRIVDTIPELKNSSSAGPTVVNPLQIGVTAAPLLASSVPPTPASVPPTPASVPPTPASVPPTPASVPPSLGTSQPPADTSGLSTAAEGLSALPVTASAVESVALASAGSSRAPGSEASDDDSLLASFAEGEGDRPAGPRGDRIHTARTAVDLEPPPARNWTTVALGAAGFCAVMVVAMLLTEAWLDASAAPDAGQGHAVVDAGAPRATDAGATLVVGGGADAGRADAGTLLAAGVDAGSRPAVPDAGPAIATTPDAGSRVAAAPDAGLAVDPEARYAGHLKSADAAARAGAFAKAVREYKAALALKPSSVAAQLGLGNAYYELDTLDAARTHLERARALAPKDPQVYLLLGAVYQSAGSRDEAIGAYQKYLDLAPGGKFARDVQNILKGLQTP